MKKIVISILATMCVCGIVSFGIIQNINAQHEAELANYGVRNEALVLALRSEYEESYELENRVDELENGIYDIMNGNDYEVSIDYGNVGYTYKEEHKGIFSDFVQIKSMLLGN